MSTDGHVYVDTETHYAVVVVVHMYASMKIHISKTHVRTYTQIRATTSHEYKLVSYTLTIMVPPVSYTLTIMVSAVSYTLTTTVVP
jgi:hypothetical protein